MQPNHNAQQLYALRCIRCGSALELGHDPRLLHLDCRYCGTDNVLPPYLVQARQQQYALELEQQSRHRAAAERTAQQQRKSRNLLLFFGLGGFFVMALFGSCMALGYSVQKAEKEATLRAEDPKVNGQELILASLDKKRREERCERIIIQPATHFKKAAPMSLDVVENDHCVHLLAATATGAALTMTYTTSIDLTRPLPAASSNVDYRLCATKGGAHSFTVSTAAEEPYTIAAIECPRTVAEGASRSRIAEPKTTGKARVEAMVKELTAAGCSHVIAEPVVDRGPQTYTLTSVKGGQCFNMLLGSGFSDVRFEVSLKDPGGNALLVPEPASQMRVMYCANRDGKYTLEVTPSTKDHWSHASLDCPRFGAEGVKREKQLRKLAGR